MWPREAGACPRKAVGTEALRHWHWGLGERQHGRFILPERLHPKSRESVPSVSRATENVVYKSRNGPLYGSPPPAAAPAPCPRIVFVRVAVHGNLLAHEHAKWTCPGYCTYCAVMLGSSALHSGRLVKLRLPGAPIPQSAVWLRRKRRGACIGATCRRPSGKS